MTLEQAEKGSCILGLIKDHKNADSKIRDLHKKGIDGDSEAIKKLALIALELNDKAIENLKVELSRI